jgi:hypothetical protein
VLVLSRLVVKHILIQKETLLQASLFEFSHSLLWKDFYFTAPVMRGYQYHNMSAAGLL